MAEDKKKVIVYADWIVKFEALDDMEAGKLIKHFFRYINDLKPEYPDRITELSFIDIKNTLKRDLLKWEIRAEKSRENGKKGGRPKEPEITNKDINEPKKPVSVNVTDTVTVTDSVSVNQITQWFKDLPNSVDLEDIARMTQSTKELLSPRVEEFKKYCEPSYPTYNKFLFHFKRWLLKNPPQQVKTRKALV